MKNKKQVWIIIGIVSITLIALAISYAYWQITKTQEGVNEITTACLDITLEDAEAGNTGISLTDQYPLSDSEGKALKPYIFTVTNNCDVEVDYHINLETIGDSATALKSSSIKAVIDSNEPKKLYDYVLATPTVNDAYAAYLLGYGVLAATGEAGSSATHELRLWIDESAPISEINKTFTSKITAIIGQGINSQGTSLATLIMNDAETNNYLYATTPNFGEAISEGDFGLYKTQDDNGDTYYFRGDVNNNYVEFGTLSENLEYYALYYDSECLDGVDCDNYELVSYVGDLEICEINGSDMGSGDYKCEQIIVAEAGSSMYWRIIRINGDGSIRMIYDGPNAIENEEENDFSTIGETYYNNSDASENYVGYVYEEDGVRTDSNAKTKLETWYATNIEADYGSYIADSIFCTDREVASTNGASIYYGGNYRLNTNKNPKLTCTQDEDKLTVLNGGLKKPIGLITADEAAMAGAIFKIASTNYLSSGVGWYWTMTPLHTLYNDVVIPRVFYVSGTGNLNGTTTTNSLSLRPVINIKANTLFNGSGTVSDPYVMANN